MYYAIRLMIIALIAVVMGRVSQANGATVCQGHCQHQRESKSEKVPDCHKAAKQEPLNKSDCCGQPCCPLNTTPVVSLNREAAPGPRLLGTIQMTPMALASAQSTPECALEPPIA